MPGEWELLREFTSRLRPAALGGFVERVFDRMKLAGEAGALLKIEEEITAAVTEAKARWQSGPTEKQAEMFAASCEPPKTVQGELPIDVSGISDSRFFEQAEAQIYEALREYAEEAEGEGNNYLRRLFAEDAAQGFAFIDLCRKRYDVAVMNPPFGEAPTACKTILATSFADQSEDLYCWFVQRGRELSEGGFVGVISSDSFLRYTDYSKYRQYLIKDSLLPLLLDLGWGVLDGAYVSAAIYIVSSNYRCNATCFFDVTSIQDKVVEVEANVDALNAGTDSESLHVHSLEIFRALEGSPFCFSFSTQFFNWVRTSPKVREDVAEHGIGAGPHNIFFRLNWELPYIERIDSTRWPRLVNGGAFSPYYRDDYLCINWRGNGALIKAHLNKIYPYLKGNVGMKIQREHIYYRPGITYGKRSDRFNAQVLPAGFIPSFNGIGLYPNKIDDSWWLLSYLNCRFVAYFLNLTCGLHKNSVYIDRIPVPLFRNSDKEFLEKAAREIYAQVRVMVSTEEVSTLFFTPPALNAKIHTIRGGMTEWRKSDRETEVGLWELQNKVEEIVTACIPAFEDLEAAVSADQGAIPLLTESVSDQRQMPDEAVPNHFDEVVRPILNRDNGSDSSDLFRLASKNHTGLHEARATLDRIQFVSEDELLYETSSIFSWVVGAIFGRWDLRYATGERPAPPLPDPFAPLPVCPPGMLQDADTGLPARETPPGYSLRISWSGILVDDPGHPEDIEARVREVLEVLWHEGADAIEQEAAGLLGVRSLRDYFRRPAGFFADHLKRYSKSRRQAPLYWPLSTASGSYTLWIYYHRLTDQTLHAAIADFLDPKLKALDRDLAARRDPAAVSALAANAARLGELAELRDEIAALRAELERVIALPWRPDLNDGVLITASPLWRLFRLGKWQKDLKACWDSLAAEEYDWAHLAYTIWPDRVREKCRIDRSLAIAHNLEELCTVESQKPKAKRTKKQPSTS